MMQNNVFWIWYPGDFELYHAMMQNFSRVERGCQWPAFWKSEGFRNRVVYRKSYEIQEETTFTVFKPAAAWGFVLVDEEKYPTDTRITIKPGTHRISVHMACLATLPSVYIEGDVVYSDHSWMAEDYDHDPIAAGCNRYFTDRNHDPSSWCYSEKIYQPVQIRAVNGGVLYSFETELTAALFVSGASCPVVYLGESEAEALDTVNCYYHCIPDKDTHRCPRQALRYAFIPDCLPGDYQVYAVHQYIDIPMRASFTCDDEEINRIFQVAAYTHMLCSGVFFLDGIKRDKWIWGGDAYQSLFVNRYLTADAGVEQRTLLALGGNAPATTHVNTIVDYSLLWILSVDAYNATYNDQEFLRFVYPKMESFMKLCLAQRDEHGFIVGRKRDWVYIDWADFDREGPLCALQMILAQALLTMEKYAPEEDKAFYKTCREDLLEQIERYYWDEEQSAYITGFTSGKRQITRHANIFAILFDIADDRRKEILLNNVLLNEAIPAITTPYFRFYELEAMCRMNRLTEVLDQIKEYWGGMIRQGAVTFWEEYDGTKKPEEQYEMYGDPFGKSMCHAWGASPVYLLAKYFVGLEMTKEGGATYKVTPRTDIFSDFNCTFPMGNKLLHITCKAGQVSVREEPVA